MKKLTKRVKAGGLWFDVPVNAMQISVDNYGMVKSHTVAPKLLPTSETWMSGGFDDFVCYLDLDGADWRECCWYVGDQSDGEAVERREWMARGAEKSIELISAHSWDKSESDGIVAATDAMEIIAAKIRAGEVE